MAPAPDLGAPGMEHNPGIQGGGCVWVTGGCARVCVVGGWVGWLGFKVALPSCSKFRVLAQSAPWS